MREGEKWVDEGGREGGGWVDEGEREVSASGKGTMCSKKGRCDQSHHTSICAVSVIAHVFSAPFYSELFSLLLSNFISLSFSHFLKEHELWFHLISSGCNRLLIFEI